MRWKFSMFFGKKNKTFFFGQTQHSICFLVINPGLIYECQKWVPSLLDEGEKEEGKAKREKKSFLLVSLSDNWYVYKPASFLSIDKATINSQHVPGSSLLYMKSKKKRENQIIQARIKIYINYSSTIIKPLTI